LGRRLAVAATSFALMAVVAACELEEGGPDVHAVPGHEPSPDLCLETTSCLPHDAPDSTAYLVDELTFASPDRLTTEFLRTHISEAVNSGELVLVMHFLPATPMHGQTLAAGPAFDAGACHAFVNPPEKSAALDLDAEAFHAQDVDVRLLMRTETGETVLDLVLPSSTVEGLFSNDGLDLAGGRGIGHGDRASIESVITVDQARAVAMPLLGVTFCGLLSGATGVIGDLDDDCSTSPDSWPSPPSESLGAEPAYRIEMGFTAACIPLATP